MKFGLLVIVLIVYVEIPRPETVPVLDVPGPGAKIRLKWKDDAVLCAQGNMREVGYRFRYNLQ